MNIHIPTPLRAYTGGEQTVNVPGATVEDVLQQLTGAYPELKRLSASSQPTFRSCVNICSPTRASCARS